MNPAESESAALKPVPRNALAVTFLLGAISALPPLAVDMNLPALPVIASAFATTAVAAGGTLGFFLFGFGLAPLISSPLSDRFGRRPILLVGLSLFTAAGLLCAAAPSIGWLLAGRIFQGMGAGIGSALPLAIIRDLFEGGAARARLSYVTLIFSVAPMVAPALGSIVLVLAGWRGIYLVLGLASAAVLLATAIGFAESVPQERRQKLHATQLFARYRLVLTHRTIVGCAAVNGCSFGCMFAFISGSPLVFITGRGYGGAAFSAVLACGALGMIGGSLLNGRLAKRGVGSSRILAASLCMGLGATICLTLLSLTHRDAIGVMLPLLMMCSATYGLVGPNAMHEAMHPMPDAAGIASSVLRLVQILAGALASALVPLCTRSNAALAMAGVMVGFAAASFLIYLIVVRRTILAPIPALSGD